MARATSVRSLAGAHMSRWNQIGFRGNIRPFFFRRMTTGNFSFVQEATIRNKRNSTVRRANKSTDKWNLRTFTFFLRSITNWGYIVLRWFVRHVTVLDRFQVIEYIRRVISRLLRQQLLGAFRIMASTRVGSRQFAKVEELRRHFRGIRNGPNFRMFVPNFGRNGFNEPFNIGALIFNVSAKLFRLRTIGGLSNF